MDQVILVLGWLGIYAPVALGTIGSSIGCTLAGQAAAGAMLDVESGYGKYIGLAAMPSTQAILGIVIMFSLNRGVTLTNAPGLAAIGVLSGVALLFNGVYQGRSLVSAIDTVKNKPEVFGLSLAPAAIVEGFAVFTFVFALVLSGALPQ
ncbi:MULTISPECIES: ATP synthase subunit C [Modicisalibacter]|uniref:ATP synthase subunit C n=1 Tax=Modicisalibacter tunisiensis TaxID=390637 RepID=A0ABS7WZB5_9GAMM|nr:MULTISPECIES: ATP synthase subunit C [Modicisalibacter]KXS37530.1 MAG: V-type H+-transporting ATPase subunit K [Halomonadaceae bacterium T82-2]MBZ9539541.1 ATP synthase subunit C [Modicisalibacter tunisiensis]MBZ9567056.1 ATP synthase subunit C [Modicisalibacter tunisiensis]